MTAKPRHLLKVTASLLNSWLYLFECFESNSQDAMDEFVKTLKREKIPTNEFMQRGIDFEAMCYDGAVPPISEKVRDGAFQVFGEKIINVKGYDVYLCGYADVIKCGKIADIKRVNAYERQKYLNSYQHHMYFELFPECTEFTYLIGAGSSKGNDINKLTFFTETYYAEDKKDMKNEIGMFFKWLIQNDLFQTYVANWTVDK